MPKHQYVPDPRLPDWLNRLLAHPFENAIALISLMFGVSLLLIGLTENEPSKSLENLSVFVSFILGIFALMGGVAILVGAYWRGDDIGKGWLIERSGLIAAGSVFVVYGIAVLYTFPGSWFSWLQPIMLGTACALRVVALTLTKRWTIIARDSREGSQNE